MLQLFGKPDPKMRERLQAAGIRLLNYIPNHCWFASVPPGLNPDHPALSPVRWIGNILPEDKFLPALFDALHEDGSVDEGDLTRMAAQYGRLDCP